MGKKILILLLVVQTLFSCKDEYCLKEIKKLTDIQLPNNIEVIECDDNLEYQFIFEYKLNDLSDVDSFIEDNGLHQYLPKKENNNNLILETSAIEYVGEFFNPDKFYPKENTTYYLQKNNYTIVFDKSKGKFMGVVEY